MAREILNRCPGCSTLDCISHGCQGEVNEGNVRKTSIIPDHATSIHKIVAKDKTRKFEKLRRHDARRSSFAG